MIIRREASSDGLISHQKKTQNRNFHNWFMNFGSGSVVQRDLIVHEPILETIYLRNNVSIAQFKSLFVSY